jgi:dephospho-CoA kinase
VSGSDHKRAFRIGLTGGIASGKSTVADMFAELGVPVIDADVIAREVVLPGQPALDEIRQRFGDTVFNAEGDLDRTQMRRLVFSDAEARHDLETILHPRIGDEVRRRAATEGGPYQVIVVPLLVGSPLVQFVDRILVVDCDEETQIERLKTRDQETVEQARKILSAQASRRARLAIADDVIDNEQDLQKIGERVKVLDEKYRSLLRAFRAKSTNR